jgi:uncharacterized protein YuzE
MQLEYDNRADVLYASFGTPQKAVAKEISGGVFIRYNPFTDEVVGVTVMDFKKRLLSVRTHGKWSRVLYGRETMNSDRSKPGIACEP